MSRAPVRPDDGLNSRIRLPRHRIPPINHLAERGFRHLLACTSSAATIPRPFTDANGNRAALRYDGHHRQDRWVFPSETSPGTVYDGVGRLESSTNTVGGVSRTLDSEYDAGSRRTRLTFPDDNYFSYAYDAAGRLMAICKLMEICENESSPVVSLSYDSLGRCEPASFAGASTSCRPVRSGTRTRSTSMLTCEMILLPTLIPAGRYGFRLQGR